MPLALLRARPGPQASPPHVQESDLDRLLKLIPTEALTLYTAIAPMTAEIGWRYTRFALFLIGLSLVPIALFVDGRNTNLMARPAQYVVRSLVFVAWANAIAWPFGPWANAHDLNWLRGPPVLVVPLLGAFALRPAPVSAQP